MPLTKVGKAQNGKRCSFRITCRKKHKKEFMRKSGLYCTYNKLKTWTLTFNPMSTDIQDNRHCDSSNFIAGVCKTKQKPQLLFSTCTKRRNRGTHKRRHHTITNVSLLKEDIRPHLWDCLGWWSLKPLVSSVYELHSVPSWVLRHVETKHCLRPDSNWSDKKETHINPSPSFIHAENKESV